MAVIVGVLQASDGGLLCPEQVGELLLGKPGCRACFEDQARDLSMHRLLGDHLAQLGIVTRKLVQDLGCVTSRLCHGYPHRDGASDSRQMPPSCGARARSRIQELRSPWSGHEQG